MDTKQRKKKKQLLFKRAYYPGCSVVAGGGAVLWIDSQQMLFQGAGSRYLSTVFVTGGLYFLVAFNVRQ